MGNLPGPLAMAGGYGRGFGNNDATVIIRGFVC
jgi:hypothetical protein